MSKFRGDINYDEIGNPDSYQRTELEWKNGRQLASYEDYSFTYNADGIRIGKTNGTVTGIESVFDPDGQLAISEGVTIVAAATRSENNINISQNSITVYGEQTNSA